MKIGKILFILGVCVWGIGTIQGQDVQLSQYYNAPLYLNPAFAGTAENTRVGLNYRTQWRGIDKPFNSVSLFADHNIQPYNSSVGLLYFRDQQGDSRLTTNEISLIYSYTIYLNDRWVLKPGLQAGMVSRNANYGSAVFGDQLTGAGQVSSSTADPVVASAASRLYGDFAAGGLLYNESVWLGTSFHHLNRPNQAFLLGDEARLPLKFSVHGGYKFYFSGKPSPKRRNFQSNETEISLTPTFLYKRQGQTSQLDLGTYLTYDILMAGLWYRGIPTAKNSTGISGTEAVVFMLGAYHKGATFGYSYDYTLSALRGSGSVHEISLIYEFELKYKNYKRGRSAPCPKFHRRYQ
jgi:type IX secretion system PorP/SprF family membrane protein